MLVVFRTDASLQIGTGHVFRCRTLARALQRRDVEIVFICRRQPGDLIQLLQQEFKVLVLSEHAYFEAASEATQNSSALGGRALYSSWLGCSEDHDAKQSLVVLADAQCSSPAWLVVDHYGLGVSWQQQMHAGLHQVSGSPPSVLVLDDLADRAHQSNVLMDANRLGPQEPNPYQDLVPEACKTLLGPAYALIDPLYPGLQPLLPVRSQLARVLVFFGGVDAANDAAVALEALSHPNLSHLFVDVVVGLGSPHQADLESRVLQRRNTRLYAGLPSLAALMARADLAIGAAGTASWERACLGLPCLVVPVADNQYQGALALQSAGVARCLDLHRESDPVSVLQTALLELNHAPESLRLMSEACLQLGDGRGLARVVASLLGPTPGLHLRSAQSADLWLYHWWANDPLVRRKSFNSDPIPLAQHRCWFDKRISSPLALLRVMVDGDGLPLGQIRFERGTENDDRAVIGFSLDALVRGRGIASQLLTMGLAELARCWGQICEAYAEVSIENPASSRAFLRAGFSEIPSSRSGVQCFSIFIRSAH